MGFDAETFEQSLGLHMYFDSSWNKVPRPFSGHVVMFQNAAVSWSSRKLKLIPQSSAEAETACGSTACKDLQFVRFVVNDLAGPQPLLRLPIPVVTDNEATALGVRNPGATARTRHYERWLFYLRELYMEKVVSIHLVSTVHMYADALTKALEKLMFTKCRNYFMNIRGGESEDARA